MIKKLGVLSLITLLFVGCDLFNDIEETINSKDLVMSNVGVDVDALPPTSANPLDQLNPALWGITINYQLEADNSANSGTAQVGAIDLDVVMNTTGAESIHMSSAGRDIPGGAVDTISLSAPLTYAQHANVITYIVTQKQASADLEMTVSGSYNFELAGFTNTAVPIPAQDITVPMN